MFSPFDRFGGMGNLYNPATAIPNWVLTPSGAIPDFDIDFANNRAFVKSTNTVVPASSLITTVRASIGTALDINNNLISFTSGQPRLTSKGLLVEESRTNLLLWSQAIGGNPASWANSGATPPTVTDNSTTSPDGTLDASLWTRNINTASFTAQILTKAASALTYTFSGFIKMNQSRYCALRMQGVFPNRADVTFDLTGGTISSVATASGTFTSASATMTPVSQGFYYVTLTATTDAAISLTLAFSFNGNNGPIDVSSATPQSGYIFGLQNELASFSTSYIPTTSVTVTRAADIITQAVMVTSTSCSLSGYGIPQAPNAATNNQAVIIVTDGTSANVANTDRNSAAGAAQALVTSATVSQYSQFTGTWNQNTLGKIALSFNAGAQNAAFGGSLMTAGTGSTFPTGLNSLHYGCSASGAGSFYDGYITRGTSWLSTALSPTNLQTITT